MDKAPDAFRTISEVAGDLDIPQHVLRFWETRFAQIKPMKRSGGRRYYRPDDVDLLKGIRRLLYGEGYTIRGVQRILREQGIKSVQALAAHSELPLPSILAPRREPVLADEEVDVDEEIGVEADDHEDEFDEAEHPHAPDPAPRRPERAAPDIRASDVMFDPLPLGGFGAEHRPGDSSDHRPVAGRAGLPETAAADLKAVLDDLMACKKLVADALKGSVRDIFPLK